MDRSTLKQYKDIYLEIKELGNEIDDMEQHLMTSEHAAIPTENLRRMLKEKIDDLAVMRREIEDAFSVLSSQERRLMRKKYLLGKPNKIIASEMCMSVDNVKRVHTLILKKMEGRS